MCASIYIYREILMHGPVYRWGSWGSGYKYITSRIIRTPIRMLSSWPLLKPTYNRLSQNPNPVTLKPKVTCSCKHAWKDARKRLCRIYNYLLQDLGMPLCLIIHYMYCPPYSNSLLWGYYLGPNIFIYWILSNCYWVGGVPKAYCQCSQHSSHVQCL